jgi:hypothetical protein
MTTFSEILDAANGLSLDEQETLLDILQHRIAERNRAQLVRDVGEGRVEFANGDVKPTTVKDIMDEVGGES